MRGTRERAINYIESQSAQNPTLRLKSLKTFYSEVDDPEWAILTLEFKLFGLRNPHSMERLRDLYRRTYLFERFAEHYGVTEQAGRPKIKSRLFALNSISSALMLDTHFEPDALSSKEVKLILAEIFECCFPSNAPVLKAVSPSAKAKKRSRNA